MTVVSFCPLLATMREKKRLMDFGTLLELNDSTEGDQRKVYSMVYMLHEWPTLKIHLGSNG